MSEQITLFDDAYQTGPEKFRRFHMDNPQVFNRLVKMARKARAAGHKRYGIAGLYEVLRWKTTVETTDPRFKVNNNWKAYYARLIMRTHPDLHDFFETRKSEADQ